MIKVAIVLVLNIDYHMGASAQSDLFNRDIIYMHPQVNWETYSHNEEPLVHHL